MAEPVQQIPLEDATRVTIDISGSNVSVNWSEDVDSIVVSGQELEFERAGDEIFLRGERRSAHRGRGGGLFGNLPNISVPGVTIDWGEGGSSIEVSDDDGVIVRTGSGGRKESPGNEPIRIDLPVAIAVASIEVENGDLELASPSGKVESQVKTGNLRSTGGNSEMTASLGSGDAEFRALGGSLNFMGGSGDVAIIECQTVTNVKAGSGEVTLANVNGVAIKVMAGSGNVTVRDCAATALSCQTGSGDIGIDGGELDRISVRSGSGDVECTAAFGPYSQSFNTGSGSVSLGIPRGLPARFEVATQGGDIDSEIQLVSVGQRGPRSRKTRRQVGSVGAGEPRAEVSVRTSSGDIRLHWLAATAKPPFQVPEPPVPPTPPVPPMPPEAPDVPEARDERDVEPKPSDPRQEILQALAAGVITVEEAESLLQKVENSTSDA